MDRKRGLEWAIVGWNGGNNDKRIGENTGCGETDEDPGVYVVDSEEGSRKGATEEKNGLEHEWQGSHNEIEVPCGYSVHLVLSVPTAIDERTAYLGLGVAAEPLLAQHGDGKT